MDPVWFVGGTFALGVIAYAVKLTWTARALDKALRDHIDANVENITRDFVKSAQDAAEGISILRRETGEMGTALRTKIHEVETWNRDTFVRKDSFEMVIGRLEKSIEKLGDKLEDKLDRFIERTQAK